MWKLPYSTYSKIDIKKKNVKVTTMACPQFLRSNQERGLAMCILPAPPSHPTIKTNQTTMKN